MYPAQHLLCAKLCAEVYDVKRDVLSIDETDVLVRVVDDVLHLAVRGTEFSQSWPLKWSWEALSNTRDTIRDLRFFPWQSEDGLWCHKGFLISAQHWVAAFEHRIAAFDLPVVVSGHSLGAGVAPHLARLLHRLNFNVREVVLFGEPRGFYRNSQYKYQRLGIKTASYVNENDWIRCVPPWGKTSVTPVRINPKGGISRSAHDIERYVAALCG